MKATKAMKALWVGFSPYTYARVAGMRGALLPKESYPALMKMGYHEVLRYLQDSEYREEITHYKVLEEGLKVVEQALNAQMMRCFQKLYRISDESMRKVLKVYLLRYDLENIKSIWRAKASGVEKAKDILIPSINFSSEWYQKLLSRNSLKEMVLDLPFRLSFSSEELFDLENALDRHYGERLMDLAQAVHGSGAMLSVFLQKELENSNLQMLLRLFQAGINDKEKYLVTPSPWVQRMAGKETMAAFITAWSEHTHQRVSGPLLTAERMEMQLDLALLREQAALWRREMLSATTILGYLFAKEIEVRNLKIILKAKKLGLDLEKWSDLVVAA